MINVTQPFLPPKEEYDELLKDIWERNWLTNNGPLVNKLELELKEYLGLDRLLYVSNGTIALQIAIKALALKGEIITTPFSYVATTSSIVWEGCTPVYVDIDPETFNIDPVKIEEAITDKTTAILATHVFGNPCDIDTISAIAKKHNLKVIYDAAHCFGSTYKGKSVLNYGDISTISFHATKLFHTVEGGAVVTNSSELAKKMAFLRNFGHDGPEKFNGVGVNGKNSELHAAMGLVNMKYANHILQKRKSDHLIYDQYLAGGKLQKPQIKDGIGYNYAYYPVVFNSEKECLAVLTELEKNQIYGRRYFYPALSRLDYIKEQEMPITEFISNRILCLPLYEQITESEIEAVCNVILKTLKK